MPKKTELERITDRVGNHTAHLILLWPITLLTFVLAFYVAQRGAGSETNSDFVAIALTIFETFLVIALAAGFWTVRSAAIERAEEASRMIARECAENEVKEYVGLFVTPKLIREIIEKSEDLGGGERLTEKSVGDMMSKLD